MTRSRRALFGKLDLTLFRAIESATSFARLRGNPQVELVHWLHQLRQAGDGDLHRLCLHHRIDTQRLDTDLAAALSSLPAGASSLSDFSPHVETAIERAWLLSSLEFGNPCIRGVQLMSALLRSPDLRRVLFEIAPAFRALAAERRPDELLALVTGSPEDAEGPYDGSSTMPAPPCEAGRAMELATPSGAALVTYCTDLTESARAERIDPVIGRGQEIGAMVDILLRRRQNNPLLTGEAGVGKTAVVEGLALAIARAEVPPKLRNARLLSLDVGALLSGAGLRGEFESRLKSLLQEAAQSTRPVILFIDEVHMLVGAGGQGAAADAANLLKPVLARGALRVIGATAWREYKRHIEKDPALARRFQVQQIMEPPASAAIDMVRGLASTFAAHHGVTVLDEAVRAAVVLSQRYLPARQLPDKAVSLLDTACARVAMSLHVPPPAVIGLRQRIASLAVEVALLRDETRIAQGCETRLARMLAARESLEKIRDELRAQKVKWRGERALVRQIQALRAEEEKEGEDEPDHLPHLDASALEEELRGLQQGTPQVFLQVDEAVVAKIVAEWTGIPAGRLLTDEAAAVLELQRTLEQRVLGQTGALELIARRIQTARACLTDPCKPAGVFLLAGPSGVGKTETALALAEAMHGGEQNLVTLNMSEFQEPHSVATLRGAPPGYVGYGEGGVLTEAVRRRPYCVVLLDEIEKAHPDVHEVFYQVFDKGWMEDGEGQRIDFRHTTILLTSNAGSAFVEHACRDAASMPSVEALCSGLAAPLRRVFSAAFLGRVSVVPYLPLSTPVMAGIAALHLRRIADRMGEQHGIDLSYADDLIAHVIGRCPVRDTGARQLAAFMDQQLLPVLSGHWLDALRSRREITRMHVGLRSHGVETLAQGAAEAAEKRIACHIEYA
ncbi:type VI secretion system ATPase TssH [Variovorax paradoxus]|jgi:type VI secretion system protein VasG|uniref:type VI secretion system ATPase TssH n=1 Tax=Variovorax paradoxus TaxID=34073 RepID=UPI0009E89157